MAGLLVEGSGVNVHLRDGSATGGCHYVGLDVFAGRDQREPELVLEPFDGSAQLRVPVTDISWVDTLSTPFRVRGLRD